MSLRLSRRRLLQGGTAALGTATLGTATLGTGLFAPAIVRAAQRPVLTHGIQSGDVRPDGGILWARADRPSRMLVEVAATESFKGARRIEGPFALEDSDFTAKLRLADLPAGEEHFYRVTLDSLEAPGSLSEPLVGRFKTAPADRRDVRFVWSGDTAGQGWGIDLSRGGMQGYRAMLEEAPDFFLNSGDCIYADGPIAAEQAMPDGGVWKNVVTEETSKVAETLAEFRGRYKYNLMDEHYRAMMAAVPAIVQWDDHETVNNWYPGEILNDERFTEKSVSLLSARANRAFHEYMPLASEALDTGRVHRVIPYGPQLDVFLLDMRSFRGPNTDTLKAEATPFLGRQQLHWLKQELLASKATWKVIAADMPIGILVRDGETYFENGANGSGPVAGREHEMAELLAFMKANGIENTVWLTADVHYTAAHYYNPEKAQFQDFLPFWEFVSGPIHAGSFGPGEMDDTFGPEVRFSKDPAGTPNLPPSAGLQFYGLVEIDGRSGVMTVTLKNVAREALFAVELTPVT